MKVIELPNPSFYELFSREVECLEKLSKHPHKNIINYYGHFIAQEINENDSR